jgi:hypothetical protein
MIAWLNRALLGLCSHTLRVALPPGFVRLGTATLADLPPGLRLVLQGAGRWGAGATVLDFESAGPLEVRGTHVHVEFSTMSLVNVRSLRCRCTVALGASRRGSARLGSARLGSARLGSALLSHRLMVPR